MSQLIRRCSNAELEKMKDNLVMPYEFIRDIERSEEYDNKLQFNYTNEVGKDTITSNLIFKQNTQELTIKDGETIIDKLPRESTLYYYWDDSKDGSRHVKIVDDTGAYKVLSYKIPIQQHLEYVLEEFEMLSDAKEIFQVTEISELGIKTTKVKLFGINLELNGFDKMVVWGNEENKLLKENYCPAALFKSIKYTYVQDNKLVINYGSTVTIIEFLEERISDEWWEAGDEEEYKKLENEEYRNAVKQALESL